MTKTYELPNGKMIMADVDEKHHTATVSVYALDDLVETVNKTSHWIDDKCSVCGKGIEDLIDSREWYRNEEPNFCPFCGLKLVNSQESFIDAI